MSAPARPNPASPVSRDAIARGVSMRSADDSAVARIITHKYPSGAGLTQVVRDLLHAELARIEATESATA